MILPMYDKLKHQQHLLSTPHAVKVVTAFYTGVLLGNISEQEY